MIRRYMMPLKAALAAGDALTAVALFNMLAWFRIDQLDGMWSISGLRPIEISIVYAALVVASLWIAGLYRLRTRWTLRREIIDVLRSMVVVSGISLSLVYVFDLSALSRLLVAMLFVAQPVVTISSRVALRLLLRALRRRGFMRREMLVIGAGPDAEAFANSVENLRDLGLRVTGHLKGNADVDGIVSRPVIGRLDELDEILRRRVIDEVAICLAAADWQYVEPATRTCEEHGKIVRVSLRQIGGLLAGGRFEEIEDTPVVTFVYGPERFIGLSIKRGLDIIVSGGALIVLSPLMLFLALYIRVTEGAPAFFVQRRIGLNGREFTCFKFRTMVRDAEARYPEIAHLNDLSGPAFKAFDDPRVTRSGHWLRRTSLDELPQLFNVLRGDMSIVGPRPASCREVEAYTSWHRRRLVMRPGLTGLWQVSARSERSFEVRAQLDMEYINRWSLWRDLKIIARTVPSILRLEGR